MAVSMIPNTPEYKYVTFELPLHAAFVADELWGLVLEPARITARTHSYCCCWLFNYNERVWSITQLAKNSFNHSIGRTHS